MPHTAKSDAEYSRESDDSSGRKWLAISSLCRPRIGLPCAVPPLDADSIRFSAACRSKFVMPNAFALDTMIGPGSPVMTKFSLVSCDHLGSRPPCWPSSTMDFTMSVMTSGAMSDTSAAQDR